MTDREAEITLATNPELQIAPAAESIHRFLSRDHIVEATDEIFAEEGYDGTTIRAIAGRLNCAVGSIYRYFTDKRELLLACGERLMEPVLEELRNPDVTFEQSCRTYLYYASGNNELYRLQFWLSLVGGDGLGVPLWIEQLLEQWSQRIGDRAEAERRWATIHGLLMLARSETEILRQVGPSSASTEDRVPQIVVNAWHAHETEDVTLL